MRIGDVNCLVSDLRILAESLFGHLHSHCQFQPVIALRKGGERTQGYLWVLVAGDVIARSVEGGESDAAIPRKIRPRFFRAFTIRKIVDILPNRYKSYKTEESENACVQRQNGQKI